MKLLSIALIAVLISNCAVIPPAPDLYNGNVAYDNGNYYNAKSHFSNALELAEKQKYKPHIATAKYGLGRSYGQLCQFEKAEKYLQEAVKLEEVISNGKGAHLSQDYFELARLYFDYEQYKNSIIYFKKAIPVVEMLGIEKSDPRGYALVLEDYAVALNKAGKSIESITISEKVSKLVKENPGRSSGFFITRFKSKCMLTSDA